MTLTPTAIPDCFVVDAPRHEDARGHFQRAWDRDAFAAAGLGGDWVQSSLSHNHARHTLRGMHFQAAPHAEGKLVRCVHGALWDVCVDLRPASPTFRRWHGEPLSAANGRALYVPPGCAHGFLTREPETTILYYMGSRFVPGADRGIRWDDPELAIPWPAPPAVISERDATYPLFADVTSGLLR